MKKQNYLLEGRLLGVQASLIGECSRNPTPVYQLALLWEDAFSFSEFFCERVFQHVCPFHDGWFTNEGTCPKTAWPLCLTLPIHPITPQVTCFLFPQMKKVLKGKYFCWCGRGETKNSRSTKRHQNQQVQKLFWAVGKSLNRCIASNGEYFEGDWSLNM